MALGDYVAFFREFFGLLKITSLEIIKIVVLIFETSDSPTATDLHDVPEDLLT